MAESTQLTLGNLKQSLAPKKRAWLSTNNIGGVYNAAYNSRQRTLYGNTFPLPERVMLNRFDRLALIAYMRSAVRNDVRIAGLIFKIALGIGTPTPHINYADPELNSKLELYLENKLSRIVAKRSRMASDLSAFCNVAYREWLIAGEVFVVFQENGKVQIVPSELVGSESEDEVKHADGVVERNGIFYDASGEVVAYRIGSRVDNDILFDDNHSQVVPERFVFWVGVPDRVEEERVSTKFAPSIDVFQDLKDLSDAKLGQFKLQSTLAYFISKNVAPEVLNPTLEILKDATPPVDDKGNPVNVEQVIYDEVNMRSEISEFKNMQVMYGEQGEDVKVLESKTNAADFEQALTLYFDAICSTFGITTEEAFIGYRRSNYSSSRASKLTWSDAVEEHRKLWTKLFDALQYWIFQRGRIIGDLPELPKDFEFARKIDWRFPRIREIDQVKAVQGDKAEYEAGLNSRSSILAQKGLYADEVDRENVNDAVRLFRLAKKAAEENNIDVATILSLMKGNGDVLPIVEQQAPVDDTQQ